MSYVIDTSGRVKVIRAQQGITLQGFNLLTNPGFEIWQRGAGPFQPVGTGGVYSADRWYAYEYSGETLQVDRESTNSLPNSLYSLKITFTYASGYSAVRQEMKFSDGYQFLAGQTDLWGSIWVKCNAAVAGSLKWNLTMDGTGAPSAPGPSVIASTEWQQLTVGPLSVPTDATYVNAGISMANSGTYYVDNAMVWYGQPPPIDYIPLSPAEEWARCQRYYEVHGAANLQGPAFLWASSHATSYVLGCGVKFMTLKPFAATLTKSGTWGVSNCGQPVGSLTGPAGYLFTYTTTAAGASAAYPNGTDDMITAEANP